MNVLEEVNKKNMSFKQGSHEGDWKATYTPPASPEEDEIKTFLDLQKIIKKMKESY